MILLLHKLVHLKKINYYSKGKFLKEPQKNYIKNHNLIFILNNNYKKFICIIDNFIGLYIALLHYFKNFVNF